MGLSLRSITKEDLESTNNLLQSLLQGISRKLLCSDLYCTFMDLCDAVISVVMIIFPIFLCDLFSDYVIHNFYENYFACEYVLLEIQGGLKVHWI